MSSPRKQYDAEFKREAVQLAKNSEKSVFTVQPVHGLGIAGLCRPDSSLTFCRCRPGLINFNLTGRTAVFFTVRWGNSLSIDILDRLDGLDGKIQVGFENHSHTLY